ncbi:group II intron maturase-specific domain-containing protein, partial [Pseudomonas sp. GCM10022186]|uniref:group II intron maturase-specific domain-containing protein n=1 Tax=Pseudomonas sp. GCM10022186 TaxID=3252650 RepID=UPI0036237D86
IRRYLEAGVMEGGLVSPRREGTPQGGPLSPLLSNILLNELDQELSRRGHRFVRYADDANVYVRSRQAGERVMTSLERFLEQRLRLRLNRTKSQVIRPWRSSYLGYGMTAHRQPKLRIASSSLQRLRERVKSLLRGRRGSQLTWLIERLNPVLRGWSSYFKLSQSKRPVDELDGWVRRSLRNVLWRHWKRPATRARMLMRLGLPEKRAWKSATNGRGPWWNAGAPHLQQALPKKRWDALG